MTREDSTSSAARPDDDEEKARTGIILRHVFVEKAKNLDNIQ
jgi:hypothetical protein